MHSAGVHRFPVVATVDVMSGPRPSVRRSKAQGQAASIEPASIPVATAHGPTYIVVTGIPASGKTTLAASLARELRLEHLDKDACLDELLDREGIPTAARRHELSRLADAMLREQAVSRKIAVLSSWWKHPQSRADSGTDVGWLRDGKARVVEVHCACPAAVAVERFVSRRRHPGHLDSRRSREELFAQFAEAERLGPLFPEAALVCGTEFPLPSGALAQLASAVRQRAGMSLPP